MINVASFSRYVSWTSFARIEGTIRPEKIYDLFLYSDSDCLNLKYINLLLFTLTKMNIVFIIIHVYLVVSS